MRDSYQVCVEARKKYVEELRINPWCRHCWRSSLTSREERNKETLEIFLLK